MTITVDIQHVYYLVMMFCAIYGILHKRKKSGN
jgi:hypothetical protein